MFYEGKIRTVPYLNGKQGIEGVIPVEGPEDILDKTRGSALES
jgi:hypothetical protein